MEKNNFQNGVTKVNETTFNNFQDNIEEEINSHVEHRYILVLTADVAKRRNNNNTSLLQGAELEH